MNNEPNTSEWRQAIWGVLDGITLTQLELVDNRARELASTRTAQSDGWLPIESAKEGPLQVWIPTTGMAWPGWKQANGKLFSNSHGLLNEPDSTYNNKILIATHWKPPAPPQQRAGNEEGEKQP